MTENQKAKAGSAVGQEAERLQPAASGSVPQGDEALELAVGGMCVNHRLFLDSVSGKPEPREVARQEADARITAKIEGLGIWLPVAR